MYFYRSFSLGAAHGSQILGEVLEQLLKDRAMQQQHHRPPRDWTRPARGCKSDNEPMEFRYVEIMGYS